MRSRKARYSLATPWSTCRGSRNYLALLAPALVAALACGEVAESPTAPASESALAMATSAALAFRQVSAGGTHTCGVDFQSRLYCWGSNQNGQQGDGTVETHRSVPTLVPIGPIAGVAPGSEHTCAITPERRVFCWGYNGQTPGPTIASS